MNHPSPPPPLTSSPPPPPPPPPPLPFPHRPPPPTPHPPIPASGHAPPNPDGRLAKGRGASRMGPSVGDHTRRYHGLLVAATKPPVGRLVALHSMIEQLVIPREDGTEEVIELS